MIDPTPYLTVAGRKVAVTHVDPPIPIRFFDYRATFADDPEGLTGWGVTPIRAVRDLESELEQQQGQP